MRARSPTKRDRFVATQHNTALRATSAPGPESALNCEPASAVANAVANVSPWGRQRRRSFALAIAIIAAHPRDYENVVPHRGI
jgi:hypothetical protein